MPILPDATSLGNDIIDIQSADSQLSTYHPRFAQRVFTLREQSLLEDISLRDIHRANRQLWRLWSYKEAAYKAVTRIYPETPFLHRQFGYVSGRFLTYKDKIRLRLYSRSQKNFIHSLAIHSSPQWRFQTTVETPKLQSKLVDGDILVWIAPVGTNQASAASRAVRRILLRGLQRYFHQENFFEVCSDAFRIPHLFAAGQKTDHYISFSHHGRFAAAVCWYRAKSLAWKEPLDLRIRYHVDLG